jgi:ribonuclease E
MQVIIARDDTLISPDFRIESLVGRKTPLNLPQPQPLPLPEPVEEDDDMYPSVSLAGENEAKKAPQSPQQGSQGEGGGRRRRRRRPFSKRRDHERHWNSKQGETPSEANSSGAEHPHSSASIEEQIVTEIMGGTPSKEKKRTEAVSSQENKVENEKQEETTKEGGGGDHPRRRRRRGRRNSQRHSQQQGGEEQKATQQSKDEGGNTSLAPFPSGSTEKRAVATHIQSVDKVEKNIDSSKPKPKQKDISIPMASLPEGAESSSKKNPHGRWWKRLLES